MIFRLSRLLPATLLALAPISLATITAAANAAADNEREHIQALMSGYILAAEGRRAEGAKRIAAVGKQRQDPTLMESAIKIAMRAGDIDLAREYAALWRDFGGGTRARQTIAELHIIGGDLPKAAPVLTQLMRDKAQTSDDLYRQLAVVKNRRQALVVGRQLFPEDADGRFGLAKMAMLAEDYPAARTALNDAMRQDPDRAELHFFGAFLAQQQADKPTAALNALEAYVSAGCHSAARRCELPAAAAAYDGYLKKASDWAAPLEAEDADEADWRLRAGVLYERWKFLTRAKNEYERLPANFGARLGLARIAKNEKNAAAALEIVLATEAENREQFVIRETSAAQLLEETQGAAAAIARLRLAQQTIPDEFSLMYNEASLLEQNGQVEESLAVLRQIIRVFPENPDGWNALGYIMADNNIDPQTAKSHIQRALRRDPQNASYLDSLGWVDYRLGNLASAIRLLRRAAELSPSAEIAAHLGEALWEADNTGEAKRVWKEALARDPDNKTLNATLERYQPF